MSANPQSKRDPSTQTPTARAIELPRRPSVASRTDSEVSVATPSATRALYSGSFVTDLPAPEAIMLVRSRDDLRQKFRALTKEWRAATEVVSSSTEIFSHPAYQRIMAMGEFAVPFILRELEREPDHWDYALWMITGENPVSPVDAGRMDRIAQAWIRWGKEHRYI